MSSFGDWPEVLIGMSGESQKKPFGYEFGEIVDVVVESRALGKDEIRWHYKTAIRSGGSQSVSCSDTTSSPSESK